MDLWQEQGQGIHIMNQVLKDTIYGKGTQRQVDFMASIGGMNEEEKNLFQLIHEGKSDIFIQESMGLSRKSYDRVEESVRAKLLLAVFECINHHMEH